MEGWQGGARGGIPSAGLFRSREATSPTAEAKPTTVSAIADDEALSALLWTYTLGSTAKMFDWPAESFPT